MRCLSDLLEKVKILCWRHICCGVLTCSSLDAFIRSPVSLVASVCTASPPWQEIDSYKYEKESWKTTNNGTSSALQEFLAAVSNITPHPVLTCFIPMTYQSTIHFDVFAIWLLNKGVTLHLLWLNHSLNPESVNAALEESQSNRAAHPIWMDHGQGRAE